MQLEYLISKLAHNSACIGLQTGLVYLHLHWKL